MREPKTTMASNYYMAAGGAWCAFVGMMVILVLTAAGVIEVRIWEWFVAAMIGCFVAGVMGGIMIGLFKKRGR